MKLANDHSRDLRFDRGPAIYEYLQIQQVGNCQMEKL